MIDLTKKLNNKRRRETYARSAEYRRVKIDSAKKRRADIREIINDHKLALGCSKCGFKGHPAALDLHHVRDKLFRVGGTLHSEEAVRAEMAKCIVLCANCHRIHHHEHGGHYR